MMEYAIKALQQRCNNEDNWYLRRWERWFYTAKALICMALRRPDPKAPCGEVRVAYTNGGHYGTPEGTFHWYEALVVGYGVFTNWRYTVYSDSN